MACPHEKHQFVGSWLNQLAQPVFQRYKKNWVIDPEGDFFGFLPENPSALFVGTFPIPETATSGFFYHSKANAFWTILENISGRRLSTIDEKLEFLIEFNVGITDVLYIAQRTDTFCSSKLDSELNPIQFNNVYRILSMRQAVKHVFLTSGGPKSKQLSGKSAGGWLGAQIRQTTKRNINSKGTNLATRRVSIPMIPGVINLHYLLTPAPNDSQLRSHLKKSPTAISSLGKLTPMAGIKDPLLKYKVFQWSVYLDNVPGLAQAGIKALNTPANRRNILMES
jgi:G:T/U-mismatch repair DNA glycosylase